MTMNKKYTIDILQELVGDKYIILDNSISSLKNGVTAINQEGYKVILYRDNIINNKIPETFHKSNPYTIDNIKLFLTNNNIDLSLLSVSYVSNTDNMIWKCRCGKEFLANWASIKSGKRLCNECSKIEKGLNSRVDNKLILDEINQRGFILCSELTQDKCVSQSYIHIKDNDGYHYNISWHTFYNQHKNPLKFHKNNPYTIDNINNYLSKERNSEYYCVDTKYVGNDVDMKFIHTSCGTEFYATLIEMQGKWVISKKYKYYKQCPKCKQTRIESVHASVLKQVFMHEYPDTILEDKSCINPKTNKPLPTDIVNHRLKIAVEIQSSYHDEYDQKIIDKFKKDYWISLGYSFFDPDIRDYTIIELVNIFFDNIKTIPNYVDYNWSNITNFTKVQEFVDKGYTIKEISELMDIPRETISGLVRDKKVILPKGYYEKVKNIKPIIRLSTNNEFIARYPTLKSITNDNFATGTVERVLYKKQSFAYNSFWLYESDYLSGNYSIPKVKDDKYLQSVAKYDINNNFIHSYDSIYEAEKDSVSTRGEILRVANGNRKSSHKEKWKFIVTS